MSQGFKVTSCQSCWSLKKVCPLASDVVEPVGLVSTRPGFEPGPNALAHKSAGMAKVADFFLRPATLTASNFEALRFTDPKFSAFKHLNLLKKHTKNQEPSSILRVVFALSKSPHLHRVY